MSIIAPPEPSEYAEYYETYVSKVPKGDIRQVLHDQRDRTLNFLGDIPGSRAAYRYAEGKWDLREVLGHINDTERVFTFRAWWFARGLPEPLPSFDQDVAVAQAGSSDRNWNSLVDEFDAIRVNTLHLFDSFAEVAWDRRGTASGYSFSVRAMAWITAGHVEHHLGLIRERYLGG